MKGIRKKIRSWVLVPIIVILKQHVNQCSLNLEKCMDEYDRGYWLGKYAAFEDSIRVLENYISDSAD